MSSTEVVVSTHHQPFRGQMPPKVFAEGVTIRETRPDYKGLVVCKMRGKYVPMMYWDTQLKDGDLVEWEVYPAGGSARGLLQVVLVIVAAVINAYVPGLGTALYAAVNFAMAMDARSKNRARDPTTPDPDEVYSAALAGNQARLYSPIPKNCGRVLLFPPFAGQPYSEFDGLNDQYYNAVYAVGIGDHEIERLLIDDTDLSHFEDIVVQRYLPPGTLPTDVLCNVVTAPEVANNELLTAYWVGGFSACQPKSKAAAIGIDVQAPRGLGNGTASGAPTNWTVSWRVEIREINDFGTALESWQILANESRTAGTFEPQRWSTKYTLARPMRCEIRVVRTDIKNDNIQIANDMAWTGLRAYLDQDAPLNPNVAHFELKMRASKQLNGVTQNRFGMIVTGKARTWDFNGQVWTDPVPTRNPAWWALDEWTSTTWGEGLPDSQIDMATVFRYAQLFDQRQDRFDYTFDSPMSGDDAVNLILRAGRSAAFERNGVKTFVRDEKTSIATFAFSAANCSEDDPFVENEKFPRRSTPDGIIVEYLDNRRWDFGDPIVCPAPGVTNPVNPVRMRFTGITGRKHAEREGLYEAAKVLYRTRTLRTTTEMEGILPTYGSMVRMMPPQQGYGQTGSVMYWDAVDQLMTLSEPPVWVDGVSNYITFITSKGGLSKRILVTQGGTDYEVVLSELPTIDIIFDDETREPTKFLIGPLETADLPCKVLSIEDGGRNEDGVQSYKISTFVDDDHVHDADVHLLPGPGEIQDPIDTTPGDVGGGYFPVARFPNVDAEVTFDFTKVNPYIVWRSVIRFTKNGELYLFDNNGYYWDGNSNTDRFDFVDAWLVDSPKDEIFTERFELMATTYAWNGGFYVNPFATNVSVIGNIGVWQSMDQDLEFGLETVETVVDPYTERGAASLSLYFQIREKQTGIIQAQGSWATNVANFYPEGDGGGQ